ncbi:MAG: hypothetical protein ACI8PZ_006060 [Myxococcota bacterium]|jgi:hypothetical protein
MLLLFALACAPEPVIDAEVWDPAPAQVAPLPGELDIDVSGGVLGGAFAFNVTGANAGDNVYVLRTLAGLGPGPCLGALGGLCTDIGGPVAVHTTIWTDASGAGERTTPVPADPDRLGVEMCFQAAVQRGLGGTLSELSPPTCIVVDRDSDGDGVGDASDPCPDDPLDACFGDDEWVFGAYDGPGTVFDPDVYWGPGSFSCAETCGFVGRSAIGARWVCNHYDGGEGEGCSPANHGEWTDELCSEQLLDGAYVPGPNPACGGEGVLRDFVDGTTSEGITWHALECQCG